MILHGDARAILPTLDLSGAVVITDPPWASGANVDIVGAGLEAETLWADVASLLGSARAVVVYQSSLDRPLAAPPLPFWQTCWMRSVPPSYRGEKMLSHVAYVYGHPPRPRGARVFAGEAVSSSTESRRARRASAHPCPMSLDHARWLVRWFGRDSRIVDPFAGGGTVLRAAAELGMEAVGIEIDKRWIACAEKAVSLGEQQTRLALVASSRGSSRGSEDAMTLPYVGSRRKTKAGDRDRTDDIQLGKQSADDDESAGATEIEPSSGEKGGDR